MESDEFVLEFCSVELLVRGLDGCDVNVLHAEGQVVTGALAASAVERSSAAIVIDAVAVSVVIGAMAWVVVIMSGPPNSQVGSPTALAKANSAVRANCEKFSPLGQRIEIGDVVVAIPTMPSHDVPLSILVVTAYTLNTAYRVKLSAALVLSKIQFLSIRQNTMDQ